MKFEMQILTLVGAVFLANCETENLNNNPTLVHGEFVGFGDYEENPLNRPVGEGLTIASNSGSVVFHSIQRQPEKVIGNGLTVPSDGGIVTGSFGGFGPEQNNGLVRQKRQLLGLDTPRRLNLLDRENGLLRQNLGLLQPNLRQQGGFLQEEPFGRQGLFNLQNGFGQRDRFPELGNFGPQNAFNPQNNFRETRLFGQQGGFRREGGFNRQNGFRQTDRFAQPGDFRFPQQGFSRQGAFGQQGGLNQQGSFVQQGDLTQQNGFNQQSGFNTQNDLDQGDRIRRQQDTTTPASTIPTTASPRYLNCLANCPTTNEYNPVCGDDSLDYHNAQKLTCAQNCGKSVQQVRLGTCQPL